MSNQTVVRAQTAHSTLAYAASKSAAIEQIADLIDVDDLRNIDPDFDDLLYDDFSKATAHLGTVICDEADEIYEKVEPAAKIKFLRELFASEVGSMSAALEASKKLLSLTLRLNEAVNNGEVYGGYDELGFAQGEIRAIIGKMTSVAYDLKENCDTFGPESVVIGLYFSFADVSEYDDEVRNIFLGYRLDGHYHAEQIAALCLLHHWGEAAFEGEPEYMEPIVKAILRCASQYQSRLMEAAA